MSNFSKFISTFQTVDTEAEKGYQFEKFCKWYLENHPYWKNEIEKVWLFNDYPNKWRRKEFGVDLIFKTKLGETWSVQAKCYKEDYYITYDDLSKFIAESSRPEIDKLLLMASTDHLGPNAKAYLSENLDKEITKILRNDFEESQIKYPNSFKELAKSKILPKPKPTGKYSYQLEPINQVVKSFEKENKGQLIMACGTGKTFTTLWIKEKLGSESTLVLLPSLSLLGQTLKEWTFGMNQEFMSLSVCSDSSVTKDTKDDDRTVTNVKDLPFPVTTNPEKVKYFLNQKGKKVIFSTYDSSHVIETVMKDKSISDFDLIICDEAHRCAGFEENKYSLVLDDKKIRGKKKLFTTATPRTYSQRLQKKAKQRDQIVLGMDNEDLFGKVFYTLSFGEAISKKLLTNYQVIIIGVDDEMIYRYISQRELIDAQKKFKIDSKSLATFIGTLKAIKDFNIKRLISFHSRLKKAEQFSDDIHDICKIVDKKYVPDGIFKTDFISGKMTAHARKQKLNQLKELVDADIMMITNARCLSEGVDVPSLDAIAMIDPKQSKTDIIQTVGRAIRLSPDKTTGSIILPVFIQKGDDPITRINKSDFKSVWEVINALKAHDENFKDILDTFRTKLGKENKKGKHVTEDIENIIIDLPVGYKKEFENSLKTILIENTTEDWNFNYGLALRFVEKYKSIEKLKAKEIYEGYSLGNWVSGQRLKYKVTNGELEKNDKRRVSKLTKDQIKKLKEIPGWSWAPIEEKFYEKFDFVKKNIKDFKDISTISSSIKFDDGELVRSWLYDKINSHRLSPLPDYQIESFKNLKNWSWEQHDRWCEEFEIIKQEKLWTRKAYTREKEIKEKYNLSRKKWLQKQRNNFKSNSKNSKALTQDKIDKLESLLGWTWHAGKAIESFIFDLKLFYKEFGHLDIPKDYESLNFENFYRQKNKFLNDYEKNKLDESDIDELNKIPGWSFIKKDEMEWNQKYNEILNFEKTGKKYSNAHTKWIRKQKNKFKLNELTDSQITLLKKLPNWTWGNKQDEENEKRWKINYQLLLRYIKEFKTAKVQHNFSFSNEDNLGYWVKRQKQFYKLGKLSTEQINLLQNSHSTWKW